MKLKLTAKTHNEELVLAHLEKTVNDVLAEKINAGKKTLQGCWNFITQEARKKAVNNCACIEDAEVFGWAVHYFAEDSIKECNASASAKVIKEPKKYKKAAKKAEPSKDKGKEQISLFDMLV